MNFLILLGTATTLISSTGSVGFGDSLEYNGTGNYTNEVVFRMTTNAFGYEDQVRYISNDYIQLNVNMRYKFSEVYIDDYENYLGITQKLYVSTNNQDYELVGLSSEVLLADAPNDYLHGNMYFNVITSVNSGDYFANYNDMINKYFKVETSISYENIHTDTDMDWFTYENTNYNTCNNLSLSKYTPSYDDALQMGYTNGYDAGVIQGEQIGYTNGYQNGYQEGMNDVSTSSSGLSHLFVEVFNAPINWFSTIFDFDILGINIAGLFLGLISILLMGWLIRRFI